MVCVFLLEPATGIFTCSTEISGFDEMQMCVVTNGLHGYQAGPVEGAIFADYGSDLGSGSTVPGNVVFLH